MNTSHRISALCFLCCASAVAQIAGSLRDDGLRQAFERTIYPLKDSGDGSWRGENRAQRLKLEFDSAAVSLRHPDGTIGFRLTGYGYGERLGKPEHALLNVTGNRVEYRRGNLTE